MAWIKTKTAVAIGVGVLLVAGIAAIIVKETAQPTDAGAQLLLKDRDEAQLKARAVEQKFRESGKGPASLGFESARRDREAASGSKLAAYDRYVKTARQLEEKARGEVEQGMLPVGCLDIARFERLQAEVDLARLEGRLSAGVP